MPGLLLVFCPILGICLFVARYFPPAKARRSSQPCGLRLPTNLTGLSSTGRPRRCCCGTRKTKARVNRRHTLAVALSGISTDFKKLKRRTWRTWPAIKMQLKTIGGNGSGPRYGRRSCRFGLVRTNSLCVLFDQNPKGPSKNLCRTGF